MAHSGCCRWFRSVRSGRGCAVPYALMTLFGIVLSTETVWAVEREAARDVAAQYCFSCHGPEQTEAELDLTLLFSDPVTFPYIDITLEDIVDLVDIEEMPPPEAEEFPGAAEREALVAWAEGELAWLEQAQRGDPGRVIMPRLTRNEYERVIRDLTGQPIASAVFLPEEGGAGEGFANVGEAQPMSMSHVEKYLSAAEFTMRHLVATPDGWAWHHVPLPEPETDREVGDRLVAMIRQWFTDEENRVYDELDASISARYSPDWAPEDGEINLFDLENGENIGNLRVGRTAFLLEAAWRARHRSEGVSLQDVAAQVSPKLPRFMLERVMALLSAPPASYPSYYSYLIDEWKAVPPPGQQSDGERLAAMKRIAQLWYLPKRKFWQYKGHPPYETSFEQGEGREAVLASAEEKGVWPFDIDLEGMEAVYLVASAAGVPQSKATAIWEGGVFTFPDGSDQAWIESLARSETVGGQADFVGESALRTEAQTAVRLSMPDGAVRFRVTARVPEEQRNAIVIQTLVLDAAPTDDELFFYPDRRPIIDGESELAKRWVEDNWPPRNAFTGNINYSRRPIPREGFVEAEAAAYLELERERDPAVQALEDDGSPRVGYLLPSDLIGLSSPERLTQLKGLYRLANGAVKDWSASPRDTLLARAREQLEPFMEKAWRRPVERAEVDEAMALCAAMLDEGAIYDEAVKQGLTLAFVSPHFVYRLPREKMPSVETGPIVALSGYELASRLSFALWASIPDAELLELAEAGRLSDPEILLAQTRRMMRDERARAMAEVFAGQWFRFQTFDSFSQPDEELFPEFTPSLAKAMQDEMIHFFDDLFRSDRPILRTLNAADTFVNGELARHYGLEDVFGRGMRNVSLQGTERRGVTGMGAFLASSSTPQRTSPVQRGVWVLEELLGDHLPDPPANVPMISLGERSEDGLTVTQQLARHREDPSCSSCHEKFDPLGIALESFDPIGRWRHTYRAGDPVANEDAMPDGQLISGASGLVAYLEGKQDEYVKHFCRKLLGYMLGRGLMAGDRELLRSMQEELGANEYRPSRAIELVVTSPQFLHRRAFDSNEIVNTAVVEVPGAGNLQPQ